MFEVGALITGTDRSYRRSIYRFVGIEKTPARYGKKFRGENLGGSFKLFSEDEDGKLQDVTDQYSIGSRPEEFDVVPVQGEDAAKIEFVSFEGRTGNTHHHWIELSVFEQAYRLATDEEIEKG